MFKPIAIGFLALLTLFTTAVSSHAPGNAILPHDRIRRGNGDFVPFELIGKPYNATNQTLDRCLESNACKAARDWNEMCTTKLNVSGPSFAYPLNISSNLASQTCFCTNGTHQRTWKQDVRNCFECIAVADVKIGRSEQARKEYVNKIVGLCDSACETPWTTAIHSLFTWYECALYDSVGHQPAGSILFPNVTKIDNCPCIAPYHLPYACAWNATRGAEGCQKCWRYADWEYCPRS